MTGIRLWTREWPVKCVWERFRSREIVQMGGQIDPITCRTCSASTSSSPPAKHHQHFHSSEQRITFLESLTTHIRSRPHDSFPQSQWPFPVPAAEVKKCRGKTRCGLRIPGLRSRPRQPRGWRRGWHAGCKRVSQGSTRNVATKSRANVGNGGALSTMFQIGLCTTNHLSSDPHE